jgi:hypothetical protein
MATTEKDIVSIQDQLLGYINFGSGIHDPQVFIAFNELFSLTLANRPALPGVLGNEPPNLITNLREPVRITDSQYPTYRTVWQGLLDRLAILTRTKGTFRDSGQAIRVLDLAFGHAIPAYIQHHRDLLFHQSQERLCNSFFVARVVQLCMQNLSEQNAEEVVSIVLQKLNSFIGHRPIAILEGKRIEPYCHERVCPIPLYVRDAGTAVGPYQRLIDRTLQLLQMTEASVLRASQFDLNHLEEIGIDPRAYDFDHPINKRPNHHFGQWDEDSINRKGYYNRFIVHEVVLDSLLARVFIDSTEQGMELPYAELLDEASVVLAGTILMAAAVSGAGPGAHDSNTSLNDLVPAIAAFRDLYYEQILDQLKPAHRDRILKEAERRQQPFGAARQDINARLANLRAKQLVNCRLASIFARMGYADAAEKQSQIVPVAAARVLCQIDCQLDVASRAIARGELVKAFRTIPEIRERLKVGIDCGAIVDPWNILGFDANYSLFPALENSVSDHRVFELVDLIERIFAICSRLWSEAAASDEETMREAIRKEFHDLVQWWRQFAAHEVAAVDAVDADEVFAAAELVAQALRLWHQGGAATGDIEFWAEHAEMFDSPKSYSLVIEALMQRGDYGTSMALLIHWLSQSNEIPLQMADTSFHELLVHWISEQRRLFFEKPGESVLPSERSGAAISEPEIWNRIRKCYDFLEANADEYWEVPQFEFPARSSLGNRRSADPNELSELESLEDGEGDSSDYASGDYDSDEAISEEYPLDKPADQSHDSLSDFDSDGINENGAYDADEADSDELDDDEESDSDSAIFRAAYDDVIYQDSTNDGFEGEVFDGSLSSDDELEAELNRILDRLEFLTSIAHYWAIAATIPLPDLRQKPLTSEQIQRLKSRREILQPWVEQAATNRAKLKTLLNSINQNFPLPRGGSDYDAMLYYDQLRVYKESLLEQTIQTCIETENANRMLQAVARAIDMLLESAENSISPQPVSPATEHQPADESRAVSNGSDHNGGDPFTIIFAGILLKDIEQVRRQCAKLSDFLQSQTFLYVPLNKGGDPDSIVKTRALQIAMLDLMRHLPALGLITETYGLVGIALTMERQNSVGNGAVTEFDELFEVAFSSMVHTMVDSTHQYQTERKAVPGSKVSEVNQSAEELLFDCTERLVEAMLAIWLDHSQTLRISVLEKVRDNNSWGRLVDFIKTYGDDLFTQQFLHLGNIRGILHQGVERWLQQLKQSPEAPDWRLLDELDDRLLFPKAVRYLTVVLEAVMENYNEYRDYNSTTTQSDHGSCLYMFLDFLRLRSRYDRICWNLKPVIWAHSIFVNNQESNVARRWRRSLTERLSAEAEKYLTSLERLRQKYSIRMESVGRRLEGRFGHQMQIDRLCALVAPAMEDPQSSESQRKFELLRLQSHTFTESTNGVGIDLPAWLAALESEVDQFQLLSRFESNEQDPPQPETIKVPISDLQNQLMKLPGRPLFD